MRRVLAIVFASIVTASIVTMTSFIHAQESVLVIVHPDSTPDEVTKKELKRIFLKQRGKWANGQSAEPIDQTPDAVRSSFSLEVLNKTLHEIDSYWQGQVFAGKSSPPKVVGSDQEVIDFVRGNPGAVGYVSSSADTSGVKILKITG